MTSVKFYLREREKYEARYWAYILVFSSFLYVLSVRSKFVFKCYKFYTSRRERYLVIDLALQTILHLFTHFGLWCDGGVAGHGWSAK